MEDAQAQLARAQAAAAAARPPDLSRLVRGRARYQRLRALIARLDKAEADVTRWEAQAEGAAEREQEAHQALHEALVAAGKCPLCGQQVVA
jgi:type II secretory pathway component PulM